MSSDFFIAQEDTDSYDKTCDIRKKANRTNTDVIEAFSGLKCPGTKLHEWDFDKSEYIRKFKKAKQCVQRRITKMREFPARTAANKTSRKKHIYPIQVAYAYGKDCLKKFATKSEQEAFKTSVDDLIKKVSKTQKNIKGYFGKSIETSIKARPKNNSIRTILDETYYDKDKQNIIERTRLFGYNALNNDDKERYQTIMNEGLPPNMEYENETNTETVINENLAILKPSKTLKRNFRKRQTAKRKPKSVTAPKNIGNVNKALAEKRFEITTASKLDEIEAKKQELIKLYIEKSYIEQKMNLLKGIYTESTGKANKINTEVFNTVVKLSGKKPSLKAVKKLGIDIPKYEAVDIRSKLYQDISDTHHHLRVRLADIIEKIKTIVLNTKNTNILIPLQEFYLHNRIDLIQAELNKEIALLPPKRLEEFTEQRAYLYSLKKLVKDTDVELSIIELQLDENIKEQKKLQERLNNTSSEKKLKTAEMRKMFEDKLKGVKDNQLILEKTMLEKYIEKTNRLRDMVNEINTKYMNPLILKDKLHSDKLQNMVLSFIR